MSKRAGRLSLVAVVGLVAAMVAVGLVLASAIGYRTGGWDLRTSMDVYRWSRYLGMLALVLSVAGLIATRPGTGRRGLVPALLGVALAVPVAAAALHWEYSVRAYPPINDITTAPEEPPAFRELAEPGMYPGSETTAAQRRAYPELKPLELNLSPNRAFDVALAVARDLGWEVIAAEPVEGRIEAVDTTPLFGFKDDVVVRIQAANGVTRLDVRSHSRVGRSDLGVNAKRIRHYLDAVHAAAE